MVLSKGFGYAQRVTRAHPGGKQRLVRVLSVVSVN